MKTIIAGGRRYHLSVRDHERLNALTITEVVSGGAPGADKGGEMWANAHRIRVKVFPADWATHRNKAGPIRNRQMAEYVGPGGQCVLFPGGTGAASMREEARRVGMLIHDFSEKGHNLRPNRDGTYDTPPRPVKADGT